MTGSHRILKTMTPGPQENLSPGNCVAATAFPKEIKTLPITVVTVYLCSQEILSLACSRSVFYTFGKGVRSVMRGVLKV